MKPSPTADLEDDDTPAPQAFSPELWPVKRCCQRLGVTVSTFYELLKDPRFPKAVLLPGRRPGKQMKRWDSTEIEAFVEMLKEARS